MNLWLTENCPASGERIVLLLGVSVGSSVLEFLREKISSKKQKVMKVIAKFINSKVY
jgi:hypothetical protein